MNLFSIDIQKRLILKGHMKWIYGLTQLHYKSPTGSNTITTIYASAMYSIFHRSFHQCTPISMHTKSKLLPNQMGCITK